MFTTKKITINSYLWNKSRFGRPLPVLSDFCLSIFVFPLCGVMASPLGQCWWPSSVLDLSQSKQIPGMHELGAPNEPLYWFRRSVAKHSLSSRSIQIDPRVHPKMLFLSAKNFVLLISSSSLFIASSMDGLLPSILRTPISACNRSECSNHGNCAGIGISSLPLCFCDLGYLGVRCEIGQPFAWIMRIFLTKSFPCRFPCSDPHRTLCLLADEGELQRIQYFQDNAGEQRLVCSCQPIGFILRLGLN